MVHISSMEMSPGGHRALFQSLSWLLRQSILQVWPLANGLADFFATLVEVSGKLSLKIQKF